MMSSKSQHTFVVLAYKESPFLEDCIKSVMNQQYNSDVVIATSTPNAFIDAIAKKYGLKVIARQRRIGARVLRVILILGCQFLRRR